MAFWDNVAKSNGSNAKRPRLSGGGGSCSYLIAIKELDTWETKKPGLKKWFGVNYEVTKSTGAGCTEVGVEAGEVKQTDGAYPSYAEDLVMDLCMAITGLSASEIDGEMIAELMANKGAAAKGVVIGCTVVNQDKKDKNDNFYTNTNYFAVDEQGDKIGK